MRGVHHKCSAITWYTAGTHVIEHSNIQCFEDMNSAGHHVESHMLLALVPLLLSVRSAICAATI